jgi:predicted CxxxxCH...CXXCH cytochrome family protein
VGSNPALLGWKHDVHATWAGLKCADCHSSVVDTLLAIKNLTLHVNGAIDTLTRNPALCARCHGPEKTACTMCHGGVDNLTGAPPAGLRGELLTSDRAVGAHSKHLTGGTTAHAFACTECHAVPVAYGSPGHLGTDSIAEMTWGPLAKPASSWDRTAKTCALTYCHGNFSGGTSANTPSWIGASPVACGSCHDVGANPSLLGGKHRRHVFNKHLGCYNCHAATVDASKNIIGLTIHVNGQFTVSFATGVGSYSAGRCTEPGGCHGDEDWY